MSNKQKFLSVLATMIQPQAKNPRVAWKTTEKMFDTALEDVKKFSPEELCEMVTYVLMGMYVLHERGETDLFLDVIYDDIRNAIHDKTCERCKGKKESEHDPEDTAADADGDAGSEGDGGVRVFGSFTEFMEAVRGPKKPPN